MSPNERLPLILGYVCAALALLGAVAIFLTSASTGAVCVFVAGLAGVVLATVALVSVEQGARGPASRTG